jgi:hypothetical protein
VKTLADTPTVWTFGDLRRVVATFAEMAIPDATPLRFEVAEEPGGDSVDTQIAFNAKLGEDWDPGTRRMYPAFVFELDFPTGDYTTTGQETT